MIRKGETFPLFDKEMKKDLFFEGIELLYFEDTTFGNFLLHTHDALEIMLVVDGDIKVMAEGQLYNAPRGSLILIPPNLLHHTVICEGTTRYERFVMHVFPEYIRKVSSALNSVQFDFLDTLRVLEYEPDSFFLYRTLFERALYTKKQSAEYQELMTPHLLMELLLEVRHALSLAKTAPLPASNNLVTAVVDYIDEHFSDPELTVDDICSPLFVSRGYLSRLFKSYTGSSIYHFLTYKRLVYSKELLAGGATVLDACMGCGFTEYTSYLKAFKAAFKITPSQYRGSVRS